jgi:RimJ/RimL family protein N-acetyltransferase
MLRMQLDPAAFAPVEPSAAVRRISHADARDLNALYALEGDGFWYSGSQIDQGIYFGAYVRGQLVAAAGTHTYSDREGVAVVGNVFTHPDYRNRGLGTAVTSAVTGRLRETCNLIVLNVDPANRGARRVYERLGYRDTGRILEAMATRRDPYSPMPMINRLLARWRSDIAGIEMVPA